MGMLTLKFVPGTARGPPEVRGPITGKMIVDDGIFGGLFSGACSFVFLWAPLGVHGPPVTVQN